MLSEVANAFQYNFALILAANQLVLAARQINDGTL